jgi:hypothetical protein
MLYTKAIYNVIMITAIIILIMTSILIFKLASRFTCVRGIHFKKPERKWEDRNKMDLEGTGFAAVDWIYIAQEVN